MIVLRILLTLPIVHASTTRGCGMKRKIKIRKEEQTEKSKKMQAKSGTHLKEPMSARLQNSTDFMRKEIYN